MKKVLYILGELTDGDVEWMIANGDRKTVLTDGVLIHEGKEIDALYIVLDGEFAVTLDELQGGEIARLDTGEMLGEISFVDSNPPTATVVAIKNSLVLSIPRQALFDKLKQDNGFAARFYRALAVFLADRLRGTVSRLGYNYGEENKKDADQDFEDELNLSLLDNVSMAGARFERILRQLRGG